MGKRGKKGTKFRRERRRKRREEIGRRRVEIKKRKEKELVCTSE